MGGSSRTEMHLISRNTSHAVVAITTMALCSALSGWWSVAGASDIEYSALDQISASYEVPITNPGDHLTLTSVLLVTSAILDTYKPDDRAIHAPKGMIYLSLQMSSGPVQQQSSDPNYGHFFSTMTPLPPSAFSYVTASHRSYPVTRVNPIDQTYNPNGTTDDGLVDATYYFTVPISNRSGTIVIAKSRTIGDEYQGFVGGAPTLLSVGGPTKIAVRFPKELTVTTTTVPRSTASSGGAAPFGGAARLLDSLFRFLVLTLVIGAVILVGTIRLFINWRQRQRSPDPRPDNRDSPASTTVHRERRRVTPVAAAPAPTSALHVDVLGPLRITPSAKDTSDPLRAFVAYLALHDDRPQTADEMQTALWPDNGTINGVTQKTFLNYVSRVRQFVGVHHLPEAQNRSGYALTNVVCDWRKFRTLALAADQAPKAQAIELRQEALRLVRGVPFEGDTTPYFEWTTAQKYVTSMIEGVTTVADKLQGDLVSAGDLDGAEWAIRRAMKLAPTELPLWRALVDICDARDDENVMTRFWADADHHLWPKAVEELRSRLVG